MWDTERKEGADISEPSFFSLPRQAVNEIQAQVVDALMAKSFDCREDLLCRVTAVEEGEIVRMEALPPILTRLMGSVPKAWA